MLPAHLELLTITLIDHFEDQIRSELGSSLLSVDISHQSNGFRHLI